MAFSPHLVRKNFTSDRRRSSTLGEKPQVRCTIRYVPYVAAARVSLPGLQASSSAPNRLTWAFLLEGGLLWHYCGSELRRADSASPV